MNSVLLHKGKSGGKTEQRKNSNGEQLPYSKIMYLRVGTDPTWFYFFPCP